MPELPDVTIYVEALRPRVIGARLERLRVRGPSLLRTVEPPIEAAEGRAVESVERLGKRIVIGLEREHFLVLHLMIAGRLRWEDNAGDTRPTADSRKRTGRARITSKNEQARMEFGPGTLILTEAGTKKRATLHLVEGRGSLRQFDRGGLDVLACDAAAFAARLRAENRTLKRALTDPRLFDGIGNAYSDEVLHAARLSPMQWTSRLSDDEARRLYDATRSTLLRWTERLRIEFGLHDGGEEEAVKGDSEPSPQPSPGGPGEGAARGRFPGPGEITAFRPDFAVHGKFGKPCPVCGTAVQRIIFAENECNYCPRCQTGGRVLADRVLSRLLKDDWPRTIEELEDGG